MDEVVVVAPTTLGSQQRVAFRAEAMAALERLGADRPGGRLIIDLGATERLDSAGLGVLVLVQLRAAEGRHSVHLRAASEEIRFLLLMTRLEDRFVIEPKA